MENKVCTRCNIEKPKTEFYLKWKDREERLAHCKKCDNQKRNKYDKENKDKIIERVEKGMVDCELHTRVCAVCNVEKKLVEFSKNKYKKYGYTYACKECIYKRKNIRNRERRQIDPIYKEMVRNWEKKTATKNRETREDFRYKENFRATLNNAIRNGKYGSKSKLNYILGVDWITFKVYIENQFREGMTWENYGEWVIDHKIPSSIVKDVTKMEKLNNHKNLQPLWWIENSEKGNKIFDEHRWLIGELLGDDFVME
jgi:hypothetical protein